MLGMDLSFSRGGRRREGSGCYDRRVRPSSSAPSDYRLPIAVVCALSLALTGCLGGTYHVSQDELTRLANTPVEQRSEGVRVVQRFVTADDPEPAPRVGARTGVVVVAPGGPGGGRGGPGGGRGGGGGGNGGGALDSGEAAAVAIVLASLAAVGLAVSEGARYDGWVRLHPMHPVHLIGPNGQQTWLPLAQLTPEWAAWAQEGVLVEDEGPWTQLMRAPLDRVGLSYGIDLGAGMLDAGGVGDNPWGFLGRIQLGGFPIQHLGLYLSIGLGWGTADGGHAVFNGRYGGEVHAYLLQIARLHLGLYAQGGRFRTKRDFGGAFPTQSDSGPYAGGGGLMEIDLTTRLGLTFRAGFSMLMPDRRDSVAVPEMSIGLSIY